MTDFEPPAPPSAAPPGAPFAPPLPPAPPGGSGKKRSWGTCLIIVGVVVGLSMLCVCGGMGFVGYQAYQNPELRRGMGAARDLYELSQAALNDPGAVALRAAGCRQASAFESAAFFETMRRMDPNLTEPLPPDAPPWIVSCELGPGEAADCGALVRTFTSAHVPPPAELGLVVHAGDAAPLCEGVYAPSGAVLRRMPEGGFLRLPSRPASTP